MLSRKKCSSKDHSEIDADIYCQICNVYMCNKCNDFHKALFKEHPSYNININMESIFTGFCKEVNHSNKLIFFCKNHNQLCCAACLSKIKNKEFGQHKDCNVCEIGEIKDEKKNILKGNIEYFDRLIKTLNNS